MDVVEHTVPFGGEYSRCAFVNEWWKLTGGWVPTSESVQWYWIRHGLFQQAG